MSSRLARTANNRVHETACDPATALKSGFPDLTSLLAAVLNNGLHNLMLAMVMNDGLHEPELLVSAYAGQRPSRPGTQSELLPPVCHF